jgi:beta-glucosidase
MPDVACGVLDRRRSRNVSCAAEPLFPFGFGLSYTQFEMSAPRLSTPRIGVQGTVQVSVDVKNTGKLAGDEVVQIYLRDDVSTVTRTVKELKAFRRVTFAPGEQRTVTFTLDSEVASIAYMHYAAHMKQECRWTDKV